jgi:putative membrane protein
VSYAQGLLIVFSLYWIAWAIRPRDRGVWLMENAFTVATVLTLVLTHARWPLSDVSYSLLALLLALHTIGGHYRYGRVPYVAWLSRVFGRAVGQRLRTKRNHYDRLVHFAFGMLVAYPAHELLVRYAHTTGVWSYILAASLVISLSALFELVEWGAAVIVAPQQGVEYLGAQGDIWDAQADMALATAGAVITLVITALLPSNM